MCSQPSSVNIAPHWRALDPIAFDSLSTLYESPFYNYQLSFHVEGYTVNSDVILFWGRKAERREAMAKGKERASISGRDVTGNTQQHATWNKPKGKYQIQKGKHITNTRKYKKNRSNIGGGKYIYTWGFGFLTFNTLCRRTTFANPARRLLIKGKYTQNTLTKTQLPPSIYIQQQYQTVTDDAGRDCR